MITNHDRFRGGKQHAFNSSWFLWARSPGTAQLGSSARDLTRVQSRCGLGCVLIGRLGQGRVASTRVRVLGRIHFPVV